MLRLGLNTILIALLWSIQGSSAAIDTRVCYLKNNVPVEDLRPCYSPDTKVISHCCDVSDTCVGNTLCLSQNGWLQIGGCTVQNWANSTIGRGDCPKYVNYCAEQYNILTLCAILENGAEYCCGAEQGMNQCCAGPKFRMQNTTHEYLDQRPWDVDILTVSTSTLPNPASTPNNDRESSVSTEARAASAYALPIGLGLGLGVPLLIASCMLYIERRKRQKAERLGSLREKTKSSTKNMARLDAVCSYEVDAEQKVGVELPLRTPIIELPQ